MKLTLTRKEAGLIVEALNKQAETLYHKAEHCDDEGDNAMEGTQAFNLSIAMGELSEKLQPGLDDYDAEHHC